MVIEESNYLVDARYLIVPETKMIVPNDIIHCVIDGEGFETDIDDGEYLSLLNFRKDDLLLALGTHNVFYRYDFSGKHFWYEVEHLRNGLEIIVNDLERISCLKFAVSWMKLSEGRTETSVWYASDPVM
ncbi:hypothetical protein [Bacillus sp. JJ722]|uniref:hypothetical protein n=1 Tax=Bacillus sp. JJ722 TaxID=3122973 RepID=UPI002FFD7351